MIVKILQSSQSPRGLPTIISNFAKYSPILMSNIAIMIHSFDWFDAGFLEGMLSPRGYILAAQKSTHCDICPLSAKTTVSAQ